MKMFLSLTVFVVSMCNNSFSQNVDSASYYVQKGNECKDGRLYLVAAQHYKKAITFNADNIEAQRQLGNVSIEMRKYQDAIVAYAAVAKKEPNDTTAAINLPKLYFSIRKWNEAIAATKKMQQLKLGKNANYLLGKSYYEIEDYAQANNYLQAAAKEDSTNADIPYSIGRGFVEMSNYRSAAPFLEKAIKIDTTKAKWVYECALNYAAIPDDKNAIIYYLLAADRGYKQDNDYYENLSISYEGLKQMDKCIEVLKKVLEKKPNDLALLNSIADMHYKTGKYQNAIDYWDRILENDKKNAKALYMIGMAYQKKGDKSKGMQLCDEAIRMDPSLESLREKKNNMGL